MEQDTLIGLTTSIHKKKFAHATGIQWYSERVRVASKARESSRRKEISARMMFPHGIFASFYEYKDGLLCNSMFTGTLEGTRLTHPLSRVSVAIYRTHRGGLHCFITLEALEEYWAMNLDLA